jgi:hypothetical protein
VTDDERAAELISRMQAMPQPVVCTGCGIAACFHEVLFSTVMGYASSPYCLGCLAEGVDTERSAFRNHALTHVQRRGCYRQVWEWASVSELGAADLHPACLWPAEVPSD